MFHLCRNQVVGFYKQNVWKHLWKSDILLVKTNYLVYSYVENWSKMG